MMFQLQNLVAPNAKKIYEVQLCCEKFYIPSYSFFFLFVKDAFASINIIKNNVETLNIINQERKF